MMEYDVNNNCYVTLAVLPGAVRGCCTQVEGENVVLINECLNDRARIEAYRHELNHLKRGDLYSGSTAAELERNV